MPSFLHFSVARGVSRLDILALLYHFNTENNNKPTSNDLMKKKNNRTDQVDINFPPSHSDLESNPDHLTHYATTPNIPIIVKKGGKNSREKFAHAQTARPPQW